MSVLLCNFRVIYLQVSMNEGLSFISSNVHITTTECVSTVLWHSTGPHKMPCFSSVEPNHRVYKPDPLKAPQSPCQSKPFTPLHPATRQIGENTTTSELLSLEPNGNQIGPVLRPTYSLFNWSLLKDALILKSEVHSTSVSETAAYLKFHPLLKGVCVGTCVCVCVCVWFSLGLISLLTVWWHHPPDNPAGSVPAAGYALHVVVLAAVLHSGTSLTTHTPPQHTPSMPPHTQSPPPHTLGHHTHSLPNHTSSGLMMDQFSNNHLENMCLDFQRVSIKIMVVIHNNLK